MKVFLVNINKFNEEADKEAIKMLNDIYKDDLTDEIMLIDDMLDD